MVLPAGKCCALGGVPVAATLALADGRLFGNPQVGWVDGDLLPNTRVEHDVPEFGKSPQIVSFFGTRIVVRRADGSLLTTSVSPYPSMLFEFVNDNVQRWEDAVRLCRFVHSDSLWATLAAMAVRGLHLDTAEIALAAIKEVDKLQYVLYIQSIPSEEGPTPNCCCTAAASTTRR